MLNRLTNAYTYIAVAFSKYEMFAYYVRNICRCRGSRQIFGKDGNGHRTLTYRRSVRGKLATRENESTGVCNYNTNVYPFEISFCRGTSERPFYFYYYFSSLYAKPIIKFPVSAGRELTVVHHIPGTRTHIIALLLAQGYSKYSRLLGRNIVAQIRCTVVVVVVVVNARL